MTSPPTPAAETALSEAERFPWTLPEGSDGRDMSGETVLGMRVAGYRWKAPIPKELQGSEWTWSYAGHWSTPAKHEAAERLFTEKDVRARLAAHPRPPEPVLAEALKPEDWVRATKTYEREMSEYGADRTESLKAAFAALAAQPAPQAREGEEDEAYEIGRRDGYARAVQDIDLLTGGDGEYRFCTNGDPERHTPDAEAMKRRIVERFSAPPSPAPAQEEGLRETARRAYEQGCADTHRALQDQPELALMRVEDAGFGEAADDYAASVLRPADKPDGGEG